jgi:hypothetical protein
VVDGSYQIGKNRVGIRCTSKRFGDQLDRALSGHWATEPAPAVYSVVVSDGNGDRGSRPGRQFHVLYRHDSPLVRTLHLPTLVRSLFAELDSLTFSQRDDAMFVGAGLVASNGSLALGPGAMSMYLDRLGRRVERAGLRLAAARFVAVDPRSGQVIPVPSQLDISPNAVARLGTVIPSDRPDNRHGLVLEGPTSVDAIFDFSDGEALVPMSRALVVSRLARGVPNFPKFGKKGLEALARLVQGTPCLGLGRPQPAAMLEILSSGLNGRTS